MDKRITTREEIKVNNNYLLGEYRINRQGKLTRHPTIKEIKITNISKYGTITYVNIKTNKTGNLYLWRNSYIYPICQESYDEFWEQYNKDAYDNIDKVTSNAEQMVKSLKKYIKKI